MAAVASPSIVVRSHGRIAGLVREMGRTVVAGLDGLLIGLTVGFIVLTAWGAPGHHLGLAAPVAIVLVGLTVTGLAAVAAFAVMLLGRGLGWTGRRIGRAVARTGHRRLAAIAARPFAIVEGLPTGWIGAFGVLLWLGLVGHTIGPLGSLTPPGILSTFVYLAGLVGALLAMAVAVAASRGEVRPGTLRRTTAGGLAIGGVVVVLVAVVFALHPGTTAGLVAYDPAFDGDPAVVAAALPRDGATVDDPGAPGPFAVERLSYGSGTDARRPAFGDEATFITPTVDASHVLPALDGGADAVRAAWWGFGTDALPLDGLVWAPVGDGPFPLVLIVHGNHAMGDFSEDGYAYLGEHLASRGYLAVSIDEDFLNGSWAGDWGGREQLTRAWLVVLHLDQWRRWASDATNPFHGRVDLERVALVGHSRGGEAVSLAAMLATRDRPESAAMRPWPTDLDVDAVVSIAPSDGQYPEPVRLAGTDFLTIEGGHDADARAWSGIRQFARTDVGAEGLKAALWAYRANHGQFNSVWGRSDFGPSGPAQLNLAPLLSEAEQQDVARTTITAFLEASLQGRDAYRMFFARPMLGREWLPEDIVLVRSVDGATTALTGDDPRDPVEGVSAVHDGFTTLRSMAVPLRALQPDQGVRAVVGHWSAGDGDATWGLDGIDAVARPSATSTLRFALADGSDVGPSPAPIDIAVEVVDAHGTRASIRLADVGALPPPLPVRLAKDDRLMAVSGVDLHLLSPVERVLQSYAIPLAAFEAASPGFEAADLTGFRLRMSRSREGSIWIAEPGLGL